MVRLNVTRELDEHLAVKREHFSAIQAHQLSLIATSWIYEAIPCLTAPWDEGLRDLTFPGQRLERAIRRRTADARTLRAHETKDVVHAQVSIGMGGKKRGDGLPLPRVVRAPHHHAHLAVLRRSRTKTRTRSEFEFGFHFIGETGNCKDSFP